MQPGGAQPVGLTHAKAASTGGWHGTDGQPSLSTGSGLHIDNFTYSYHQSGMFVRSRGSGRLAAGIPEQNAQHGKDRHERNYDGSAW
ncbi:MAG: hypothetical protein GY894_08070 [Planctomycetes bacterium]|jgi:hypothetical protein|nr:hypothetical protein [Planctomycetota bacterium]MCP4839302.1 hypothetical protein [Planctomycetota bacterium]